jgi:hypothetical protein
VDITHTHTSNVLAFGGTGSTTRRVSFSVWIACKLHADPMIPQKPLKSTFPVKIFRRFFYFLINANPTISPNFMVIGQFLFFGLFGIAPPNIVEMQVACVPGHLYPAGGGTEETTLERFRSDDVLDVEFHSRSGKLILNDRGVHTPRRRFETVVVSGPEIYNGGDGADGVGEGVFRGFCISINEKTTKLQPCKVNENARSGVYAIYLGDSMGVSE